MRRILILLCCASLASLEMRTLQQYFISRNTRSKLVPGYDLNKPAKFVLINATRSEPTTEEAQILNKMNDRQIEAKCSDCVDKKSHNTANSLETKDKHTKSSDNTQQASNMELVYHMDHGYQLDNEDVRNDFKSYGGWPYFYHSPYEYEPMAFDYEYQKAKDKRFVSPDRVIPVYESVDDYVPSSPTYSALKYKQADSYVTDNPLYGNQPFYSYILGDYFDKTYDDDPLNFKGLSWDKELDHKMYLNDIYEFPKRIRRLDENSDLFVGQDSLQESPSFRNHELKSSDDSRDDNYSYAGDKEEIIGIDTQTKDLSDNFANRFGSEDHSNEAQYSVKNNEDKGEKKKGFRKVYHKDEYQEQKEYFDDKNKSFNNEEKGKSKFRLGGSEAILQSQAKAALGDDKNLIKSTANRDFDEKYGNKVIDEDLYRNLAKETALSNNAEYFNV